MAVARDASGSNADLSKEYANEGDAEMAYQDGQDGMQDGEDVDMENMENGEADEMQDEEFLEEMGDEADEMQDEDQQQDEPQDADADAQVESTEKDEVFEENEDLIAAGSVRLNGKLPFRFYFSPQLKFIDTPSIQVSQAHANNNSNNNDSKSLKKTEWDSTFTAYPSEKGNAMMCLQSEGFPALLSGMRANQGIQAGRYYFETKMLDTPKVVRIGFATAHDSLCLVEKNTYFPLFVHIAISTIKVQYFLHAEI